MYIKRQTHSTSLNNCIINTLSSTVSCTIILSLTLYTSLYPCCLCWKSCNTTRRWTASLSALLRLIVLYPSICLYLQDAAFITCLQHPWYTSIQPEQRIKKYRQRALPRVASAIITGDITRTRHSRKKRCLTRSPTTPIQPSPAPAAAVAATETGTGSPSLQTHEVVSPSCFRFVEFSTHTFQQQYRSVAIMARRAGRQAIKSSSTIMAGKSSNRQGLLIGTNSDGSEPHQLYCSLCSWRMERLNRQHHSLVICDLSARLASSVDQSKNEAAIDGL